MIIMAGDGCDALISFDIWRLARRFPKFNTDTITSVRWDEAKLNAVLKIRDAEERERFDDTN